MGDGADMMAVVVVVVVAVGVRAEERTQRMQACNADRG